ncbi:hypothetical protein [Lapillicoccus sp.]|uniref:hypothetical protein n=1 Tax=Lapillicoccus sp. TaxID=1909287 RepID=UPI0032679BF0
MPSSLRVIDIADALQRRLYPSVTTWNRLEARPRTQSFDRALQAEVRDALWMLTKQWQMGEFRGSDAGSPVFARLRIDTTRLTKYRAGSDRAELLPYDVPLEATVERRPLTTTMAGRAVALDVRMAMGREWLALVAAVGGYRQAFLDAYPFHAPDPTDPADAALCCDPQVWELLSAVAGRAMDGQALHEYLLADSAHHAYDGVVGIVSGDHLAIDTAATAFLAWFDRLVVQPPAGGEDAWDPQRLDYQFRVSAPLTDGSEKVYVADDYAQGRLDWYSLDVDGTTTALDAVPGSTTTGLPAQDARTVIPVPVSFSGMPNTRWWTFEDRQTNYGDVDAATTDLAKLMFLEFALVYANDWFVIPYTLPAGAVASVRGVAVTNVFGERLWIESADAGADSAWQRWSMFTVNVRGVADAAADTSLLLLPTAAKVDQGPRTEDILLLRDEVANMVWGVETTVPLATGDAGRGLEQARLLHAFLQAQIGAGPPPPPAAAAIRYQVMSSVPENWIPFLPVHVDGTNREIQLQRAALPRILDGDTEPPVRVQPRTTLMRQGLDLTPAQTYFVHEEEVPRAGARLYQAFQRTRGTDGRVYVWQRAGRQTGRGEGSSGLSFDELVTSPTT